MGSTECFLEAPWRSRGVIRRNSSIGLLSVEGS